MKFRVKNLNAEGPQTSFNEWRSRQLGKSGWGGVPVLTTADTVKVVRSWSNPVGLQDSATLLEIECTTVQNKKQVAHGLLLLCLRDATKCRRKSPPRIRRC